MPLQIVSPLRGTEDDALILRQPLLFYPVDGFRLLQAVERRPRQRMAQAAGIRRYRRIADLVGKPDVNRTASLDHRTIKNVIFVLVLWLPG